MKPPPLRERVLAALALSPMTRAQLATALSVWPHSVHNALQDLASRNQVEITGRKHGWEGRPSYIWRRLA